MAKKKQKEGRPTKYLSEYNEQVEKLCKLGATDKQLADFFNVTEKTINNWKVKPRSHDRTCIAKNMTRLQISLLVAEMFGYRHYQTERIIGISQGKIQQELDIAIKKIVKLGIPKCKTCKWRGKGGA